MGIQKVSLFHVTILFDLQRPSNHIWSPCLFIFFIYINKNYMINIIFTHSSLGNMTVTPLNTHCPFLYWFEDVVKHRVPGDTDYLFEVPAKVGGRGPLDPFGWRGGVGGGGVFVVLLGLGDDRAGGIGRFGEILEWVLGISIVNLQYKKTQ